MATAACLPTHPGHRTSVREDAHLWPVSTWLDLGLPPIHVALTRPQRWAVALLQADPDLARWRDRARWHAALAKLDPTFDRARSRQVLREVQALRETGALVPLDQAQACRHRRRCSPEERGARIEACLAGLARSL